MPENYTIVPLGKLLDRFGIYEKVEIGSCSVCAGMPAVLFLPGSDEVKTAEFEIKELAIYGNLSCSCESCWNTNKQKAITKDKVIKKLIN